MKTLRPRIAVVNLQTAQPPPKTANSFYSSREWIELRDRVRREAGGRCQAPGCGRIEPPMYVDHRVELKDGGAPLDRRNVWLLCGSCHSRKTAAERARRTAQRPGGSRLDGGRRGPQPQGAAFTDFFPARHSPQRARMGWIRRRPD